MSEKMCMVELIILSVLSYNHKKLANVIAQSEHCISNFSLLL